MDKYKVAIVDDDEVALENLSFELGKDARFSLKGTARNGKQGKKLIAKVQPDLLFLDVEMPDMTGMELLQEIRGSVSWNMRIVFYTAYDKYMVQAIREAAFDYLLKPFEEQEFRDILARFVEQAELGRECHIPLVRRCMPDRHLSYLRQPMICVHCVRLKSVFFAIAPSVSSGR
jgi:two-component system LytT family response regulator